MPEVSRFYGIIIRMFYDEHPPAHFHAVYGDQNARIDIETLEILDGDLTPRAYRLASEWAAAHREELRANWNRVMAAQPPTQIAPLD